MLDTTLNNLFQNDLLPAFGCRSGSVTSGAVKTFVSRLNKKKPCEMTKGNIKLLGMSEIDTKLDMSTLNVVQKPIR